MVRIYYSATKLRIINDIHKPPIGGFSIAKTLYTTNNKNEIALQVLPTPVTL